MAFTSFREKLDKLNWRTLSNLDLTNVGIENNEQFEDVIRNIVNSRLNNEDILKLRSERMIKIFLMDQTLLELLLNVQEKLYIKQQKKTNIHQGLSSEYERLRSLLEDRKNDIETLRSRKKALQKENMDLCLSKKKMYAKQCPYCDKAFSNMQYLESHLVKRHSDEIRSLKEAELKKLEEKYRRELEAKLRIEAEKKKEEDKINQIHQLEIEKIRSRLSIKVLELNKAEESKSNLENENQRIERKLKLKERQITELAQKESKLEEELLLKTQEIEKALKKEKENALRIQAPPKMEYVDTTNIHVIQTKPLILEMVKIPTISKQFRPSPSKSNLSSESVDIGGLHLFEPGSLIPTEVDARIGNSRKPQYLYFDKNRQDTKKVAENFIPEGPAFDEDEYMNKKIQKGNKINEKRIQRIIDEFNIRTASRGTTEISKEEEERMKVLIDKKCEEKLKEFSSCSLRDFESKKFIADSSFDDLINLADKIANYNNNKRKELIGRNYAYSDEYQKNKQLYNSFELPKELIVPSASVVSNEIEKRLIKNRLTDSEKRKIRDNQNAKLLSIGGSNSNPDISRLLETNSEPAPIQNSPPLGNPFALIFSGERNNPTKDIQLAQAVVLNSTPEITLNIPKKQIFSDDEEDMEGLISRVPKDYNYTQKSSLISEDHKSIKKIQGNEKELKKRREAEFKKLENQINPTYSSSLNPIAEEEEEEMERPVTAGLNQQIKPTGDIGLFGTKEPNPFGESAVTGHSSGKNSITNNTASKFKLQRASPSNGKNQVDDDDEYDDVFS